MVSFFRRLLRVEIVCSQTLSWTILRLAGLVFDARSSTTDISEMRRTNEEATLNQILRRNQIANRAGAKKLDG